MPIPAGEGIGQAAASSTLPRLPRGSWTRSDHRIMTRSDDSTDDDHDEDPDRSSSLRELAESTRRRRSGDRSTRSGPDIDLDTGDEDDEDRFEFDDPDEFVDRDDWTLPSELDGTANVLLLGPHRGEAADRCCMNLLSEVASQPRTVLFVTLTRSVDDRLETWRRHLDDTPATMAILSLGEQPRSPGVTETVSVQGGAGDVTIRSVADPSDLTRLGISLTEQLEALPDGGAGSALCVHSLTSLLQYVDARRLFRFVLILQKKVDSVGAVAHYHMDPDSHDPQTVSVFESLFDTVVRTTEDGELELVSSST